MQLLKGFRQSNFLKGPPKNKTGGEDLPTELSGERWPPIPLEGQLSGVCSSRKGLPKLLCRFPRWGGEYTLLET